MKAFIFACALAALVAIAVCLTDEQANILKKNHAVCLLETKVDEAMVMKLRKEKDFSNKNAELQNFVFCMFIKCGIITPEGVLIKDVALSKIPGADMAKVEAAFVACSDIRGNSPQETVYLMAECYYKHNPDHDMF